MVLFFIPNIVLDVKPLIPVLQEVCQEFNHKKIVKNYLLFYKCGIECYFFTENVFTLKYIRRFKYVWNVSLKIGWILALNYNAISFCSIIVSRQCHQKT